MKRIGGAIKGLMGTRRASFFAGCQMGPPDPIFAIGVAFKEDVSPKRVNLSIGVYRGDDGLPCVLPSVREAERIVIEKKLDMEYAPITGLPGFVRLAQELVFGEASPLLASKRVASAQCISGTGSLRVAGELLAHIAPGAKIYMPTPTWPNHMNIMRSSRLDVQRYTYYDNTKNEVDIEGMLRDLRAAPPGSIVLLHACAHNPTGMDPTPAQWKRILEVVQNQRLLPLLDNAYQGFASGSLQQDAFAVGLFTSECPNVVLCQSFAKNFGLYGHRVGAVHVQCADQAEAARVDSQLKLVIRPMYSNPPLHGARIVETVLTTPDLRNRWMQELKIMADRMNSMRQQLLVDLTALGSKKDWSHIGRQIGMMAFTGLSKDQVGLLKRDHHVYLTEDGRMAIPGLTTKNVRYVAESFHAVTK